MLEIFGHFTYPSDDHIGEYLSFAYNFTGLKWPYGRESSKVYPEEEKTVDFFTPYLKGERKIDEVIAWRTEELAIPIICDIEFDRKIVREAVNVLNRGKYVENLPEDAVVEVPAMIDKDGIHPQKIGELPEALAAFSRTQISIQKLIIEAYKKRSKNLLLQALLLDPVVDNVENAEKMLNEMLFLQSKFLPEFK
jgi:alpha-galactosidase